MNGLSARKKKGTSLQVFLNSYFSSNHKLLTQKMSIFFSNPFQMLPFQGIFSMAFLPIVIYSKQGRIATGRHGVMKIALIKDQKQIGKFIIKRPKVIGAS